LDDVEARALLAARLCFPTFSKGIARVLRKRSTPRTAIWTGPSRVSPGAKESVGQSSLAAQIQQGINDAVFAAAVVITPAQALEWGGRVKHSICAN
jgi:hypothetical protein